MAPTVTLTCGHCGHTIGAEVIWAAGHSNQSPGAKLDFSRPMCLKCPVCQEAIARSSRGQVFPPRPEGRSVDFLPPEIEMAWNEARNAYSVAAFTASEMMCRKILMHIAVDVAGAPCGQAVP
jgi:hypothetical protein